MAPVRPFTDPRPGYPPAEGRGPGRGVATSDRAYRGLDEEDTAEGWLDAENTPFPGVTREPAVGRRGRKAVDVGVAAPNPTAVDAVPTIMKALDAPSRTTGSADVARTTAATKSATAETPRENTRRASGGTTPAATRAPRTTTATHARAATAGPAQSEAKAPDARAQGHELAALLLAATAIFLGLGIASYDERGGGDWVGLVGARFAGALVCGLGVVAWAIPVELFTFTLPLLRRKPLRITAARLAGDVVLASVSAALVHVAFTGQQVFGGHPPGGTLGELFGEFLRALFSTVGTFLVGFTVIALVLITRAAFSFIDFANRAGETGLRAADKVKSSVSNVAEAWQQAGELSRPQQEPLLLREANMGLAAGLFESEPTDERSGAPSQEQSAALELRMPAESRVPPEARDIARKLAEQTSAGSEPQHPPAIVMASDIRRGATTPVTLGGAGSTPATGEAAANALVPKPRGRRRKAEVNVDGDGRGVAESPLPTIGASEVPVVVTTGASAVPLATTTASAAGAPLDQAEPPAATSAGAPAPMASNTEQPVRARRRERTARPQLREEAPASEPTIVRRQADALPPRESTSAEPARLVRSDVNAAAANPAAANTNARRAQGEELRASTLRPQRSASSPVKRETVASSPAIDMDGDDGASPDECDENPMDRSGAEVYEAFDRAVASRRNGRSDDLVGARSNVDDGAVAVDEVDQGVSAHREATGDFAPASSPACERAADGQDGLDEAGSDAADSDDEGRDQSRGIGEADESDDLEDSGLAEGMAAAGESDELESPDEAEANADESEEDEPDVDDGDEGESGVDDEDESESAADESNEGDGEYAGDEPGDLDDDIIDPLPPPPEPVRAAPPAPIPRVMPPQTAASPAAAPRPTSAPVMTPPRPPKPYRAHFELPSADLLSPAPEDGPGIDEEALRADARALVSTLATYKVVGEVREIHPGPVVTTFELEPRIGTKVREVEGLANDLRLSLAKESVRIVAPIPGKNRIGFELPNAQRIPVNFRELVEDRRFAEFKAALPVVLGRDIVGAPAYADLASMPHLLVAGATGAGKSVGLNVMLTSLLYRRTPEDLRLIMVDPKVVELAPFDRIPHMLLPVVTDMKQALNALKWCVDEMERRYQLLAKAGVKNITTYNAWREKVISGAVRNPLPRQAVAIDHNGLPEVIEPKDPSVGEQPIPEKLPYLVVVVDEFADLMMSVGKGEVEPPIARLAQKARAAGIHVVLATQRPSVDVITGMIKANFPTRVAFRVAQRVDSRTILDAQGAEYLLGKGDMLVSLNGTNGLRRIQCPFVSEDEVQKVTDFLRDQGEPVFDESILAPRDEDGSGEEEEEGLSPKDQELFEQAVELVREARKCSTSWLQRKMGLGYNKAARFVDRMERLNFVGPPVGAGKDREILI